MRVLLYLIPLFLLVGLVGCAGDEEQEAPHQAIDEYYDVAGLLQQQMEVLVARNARLVKQVAYGGSAETDTLPLTQETLAQELLMFNEMNINKADLSGRYLKEVQQKEGYEITRYQGDEPEELRVNYLEVYRQEGEVVRLEALFSDRNLLYNSTRKIVLNLNEQQLPQTYSIEGIQKMIFRDKVEYSIEGRFMY